MSMTDFQESMNMCMKNEQVREFKYCIELKKVVLNSKHQNQHDIVTSQKSLQNLFLTLFPHPPSLPMQPPHPNLLGYLGAGVSMAGHDQAAVLLSLQWSL